MESPFVIRDPYKDKLRAWNSELYRLSSMLNDDPRIIESFKETLFNFPTSNDHEYQIYYNAHLHSLHERQEKMGISLDPHPPYDYQEPQYPSYEEERVYEPMYVQDHDKIVFIDDQGGSLDDLLPHAKVGCCTII